MFLQMAEKKFDRWVIPELDPLPISNPMRHPIEYDSDFLLSFDLLIRRMLHDTLSHSNKNNKIKHDQ